MRAIAEYNFNSGEAKRLVWEIKVNRLNIAFRCMRLLRAVAPFVAPEET